MAVNFPHNQAVSLFGGGQKNRFFSLSLFFFFFFFSFLLWDSLSYISPGFIRVICFLSDQRL